MESLNRHALKAYSGLQFVSSILIIIMALLLLVNIFSRGLFNSPLFGSFEIVSYLSMLVAIFSLTINEYKDGNIKVDMVTEYLKPKMKNIVSIVTDFVSLSIIVVMAYASYRLIVNKLQRGDLTSTLLIPQWIFAAFLTFGFVTLAICILFKIITKIATHKSIVNEKPVEEPEIEVPMDSFY